MLCAVKVVGHAVKLEIPAPGHTLKMQVYSDRGLRGMMSDSIPCNETSLRLRACSPFISS